MMKIAVIGATGMVGRAMFKVLEERNLKIDEILPVATEKSVGNKVLFKEKELEVIGIDDAVKQKPDIAIFSAGSSVSLKYAPQFSDVGTFVIDNSSAWRMDKTKKLIVPEINANELGKEDKIIANPNCSTIQLVMVLAPLHKKYNIKRIVVSTYQSITGTGKAAVQQMEDERKGVDGKKVYPYRIDLNCIPHCDIFEENGYTKEEMKIVNETNKILSSNIKITATAVRVPVLGGHSESVNIQFEEEYELQELKAILTETPGVTFFDDVKNNIYPMPLFSMDRDDVFVGRIRRDFSNEKSLNLWITADNIRKGAATNAVQIAEYLIEKEFV